MTSFSDTGINKAGIMVSRNRPLALIVGVAGFIGSYLAEELLHKKIQVVGVDNFSTGKKEHLLELTKDRDFHLLNADINKGPRELATLLLPRIDYLFILLDSKSDLPRQLSTILEYLNQAKQSLPDASHHLADRPKVVLVSTIELYEAELDRELIYYKDAEIVFSKLAKELELNARIVRLAAVFGPRMHFRFNDPMIHLIQSALSEDLPKEDSSTAFTTRALYVDDAVGLILKSVLAGGTSGKIYDGCLLYPLKVAEVKQILLNPAWHEAKGFIPSELPPWSSPNLKRSVSELNWKPDRKVVEQLKRTLNYFQTNHISVPSRLKLVNPIAENSPWTKKSLFDQVLPDYNEKPATKSWVEEKPKLKKSRGLRLPKFKTQNLSFFIIGLGLILAGLLWPLLDISIGAVSIRHNLKVSTQALQQGDFATSAQKIGETRKTISQLQDLSRSLGLIKTIPPLSPQFNQYDRLLQLLSDGMDGVEHGIKGAATLFQTTKIISGEDRSDPAPLYTQAGIELSEAEDKINAVNLSLQDPQTLQSLPPFIRSRAADSAERLKYYLDLISKAKVAASLMPSLTALNGKKSYLVLLQNNLELRPGGGFIGSYAKVDFEQGRVSNILVDDIYNLDGNLQEVIEPPAEIKADLGQNRWYLRDSNFEPDFPTSARQAEFFYTKEGGAKVQGVLALDLSASAKLLDAVGGLDLPDYNEHVDGRNLFAKAISHAEVGFFPGSQAKKNYLTSVETGLFNKIFFLSKQNWPGIIQALGESLQEKHFMLYFADPHLLSVTASENWAGIMPRPSDPVDGQTRDFLAPVEANLGADKANYYLKRSYQLQTSIGKEGQIYHHLTIHYQNDSPSEVFPAGKYKNRFRLYLPSGTKLTKATFKAQDYLSQISNFADYGRSGYSGLLEILPKEQADLTLDYQLEKPLSFKDGQASYQLDLWKQPGLDKDLFNWQLTYPINMKLKSSENGHSKDQELDITTDLIQDRSLAITLSQS